MGGGWCLWGQIACHRAGILAGSALQDLVTSELPGTADYLAARPMVWWLGVVAAGAVMMTTDWWWLDPVTGLVVSIVILATTWSLLREALAQALDAVPGHVDAGAVRRHLEEIPGVEEVHHLHIWPLGTTEVALTVHLVIPSARHDPSLLARLAAELREEFGIGHTTIQVETPETREDCTRTANGCA